MSDFADIKEIRIDPSALFKRATFLAVGFVIFVVLTTSWVTIGPEERGVVVRFGKYSRTLDPGLHFKLPWGIENVYKVAVQRLLKEEFGFQTVRAGVRTQYSNRNFDDQALMLTGDLNVANLEWVTQYRISQPRDYLFKVRGVTSTFRVMNEATMREIIGDRSINEVLTFGRSAIEIEMKTRLQDLCKHYEMGITVDQVILQDVSPPKEVQEAFSEVVQAQQEKETLINRARQEYNKVVPKAEGEAAKKVEEAKGYAVERVNKAKGEAERFSAMFTAYEKAPEVTRRRIFLETMDKVLNQVGKKVIMDGQSTGVLPLLNLDNNSQ